MADLSCPWAGDIDFDDTGDFLAVFSADEVRQRLIRNFLSSSYQPPDASNPLGSPGDDPFDPNYGGNARRYVDRTPTRAALLAIKNRWADVIKNDPDTSKTIAPTIFIQVTSGGSITANVDVTLSSGQTLSIPNLEIIP